MKPPNSKPIQVKTIFILGDLKTYVGKFDAFFRNEGFNIIFSEDITELYKYLELRQPTIVILKISSDSLYKSDIIQIRKNCSGPLILLTDRTDAKYHISTLELGFDELLNKSLNIESQINRVKILIDHWESDHNSSNKTIKIGELIITNSRREVFLRDELLNIKSIEFEILWYLVNKIGKIVSRSELYNRLYKSDYNGIDRSLDIYISRIRSKLCDDPKDPRYIKTVRGEGYLFLPDA